MLVKKLKIQNEILENAELKSVLENGDEVYNVPTDLNVLKKCAVETVEWEIEQELSPKANAINSKLALIAMNFVVVSNPLLEENKNLTDTQKKIIANAKKLFEIGYTDSNLANNAILKTFELLVKAQEKIDSIMKSNSVEAIIEILNGDA